MITKTDIIKMVKNVKRRSQGVPDRTLIHPMREWGIGVVIFTVVSIAGSVYIARQYVSYSQVDVRASAKPGASLVYDEVRTATVLELYEKRRNSFDALASRVYDRSEPEAEQSSEESRESELVESETNTTDSESEASEDLGVPQLE